MTDAMWQQLVAGAGGTAVVVYLLLKVTIPSMMKAFRESIESIVKAHQLDREADRKAHKENTRLIKEAVDRIPCITPSRGPVVSDTDTFPKVREPDSKD